MNTVHDWFKQEVYRWRTGASVIWSALLSPPILTLYIFLARFSFFRPISSTSEFLCFLVSWQFYASLVFGVALYIALISYNSRHFSVLPDIPLTQLEFLASMCRGSKLRHGLVTSLGCTMIVWSFSSFPGSSYTSIFTHCPAKSEYNCFNERQLVFILNGFFTGFILHYTFYSQRDGYIEFLPIRRSKLFTVKNSFRAIITSAFHSSFSSLKYFYTLYFIFGDIPKYYVKTLLNLDSRSLPPINSLYGMLDLDLFIQLLLVGSLLRILWRLSTLLYKLYNTEPFLFIIESDMDLYQNKCLHNALSCDSAPLIQHLAFLDLHRLSTHDAVRRQAIFSLSQPGGHPHNWNRILATCLGLLDTFSHKVQTQIYATSAQGYINDENSQIDNGCVQMKSAENVNSGFNQFIKKIPILCHLIDKLPDAENRRLFASTQVHIWAIDGLANLACTSYSEDKYGIVQRSLSMIIISLLALYQILEKHFQITNLASRRVKILPLSRDSSLQQTLRLSVKTAIYKICYTFGKHLKELGLNDDQLKLLQQFCDYKQ